MVRGSWSVARGFWLALVVTALFIGGCATVGERVLLAGTTGLLRFSSVDVDAAIAIARQSQDRLAEACYRAIRNHVDQPLRIEPAGPVSAYAAARVRVREARAGLAPDVHEKCAPLVLDAAAFARDFRSALESPR